MKTAKKIAGMSFSFLFIEKQITLSKTSSILLRISAFVFLCFKCYRLFRFNPPAPEVLSQFKETKIEGGALNS